MGFLRRDDDSEAAEAQAPARRRQAAVDQAPHAAAYQSGSMSGIPESGRQRIERMKRDAKRGFFTSDL
ncbi:MAG: hypothetical protein ACRDL5_04390, partial [Solirubrobacteraceae bacterium]